MQLSWIFVVTAVCIDSDIQCVSFEELTIRYADGRRRFSYTHAVYVTVYEPACLHTFEWKHTSWVDRWWGVRCTPSIYRRLKQWMSYTYDEVKCIHRAKLIQKIRIFHQFFSMRKRTSRQQEREFVFLYSCICMWCLVDGGYVNLHIMIVINIIISSILKVRICVDAWWHTNLPR